MFTKCSQCHHPGGSAPFSLLTYREARSHATQIAVVAKARVMPPWKVDPAGHKFIGLDPLTDSEIAILEKWVADGAREGNPRDLPAAPVRTGGWQLGKPDLVVTLPAPFVLPADGPDVSRVFVLPLPVDRRRYVRGIEFRANSPRVHHANIRVDATPASRELDEREAEPGYDGIILRSAVYPDGHFLGWTPGQAAPLLPAGLAWTLEPNSDLVVQVHLVPGGKPEPIQPSIGFYFTDDPPTQTPVMMRLSNQRIDIPPGDADYIVERFVRAAGRRRGARVAASRALPGARRVRHRPCSRMEAANRSSRFRTGTSGGSMSIATRLQSRCRKARPSPCGTGTTTRPRIHVIPPTPPVRVPWGQQSREEMGDFWLQVVTKTPADRELLDRTFRAKWMATDVIGLDSLIQREPDRASLRDDIAVLYMELNRPADAVPHFEAALKLKPGSAAAHFNYGTALAGAGRFEEAIAQYERALALRPGYAIAQNNLGTALLQLGRPQPAVAAFREAARIDPQPGGGPPERRSGLSRAQGLS